MEITKGVYDVTYLEQHNKIHVAKQTKKKMKIQENNVQDVIFCFCPVFNIQLAYAPRRYRRAIDRAVPLRDLPNRGIILKS